MYTVSTVWWVGDDRSYIWQFSYTAAASAAAAAMTTTTTTTKYYYCYCTCRFTPVPDSVLNKNVAMGEMSTTAVDPRGLTTPFPGDMTPGFNTPASK